MSLSRDALWEGLGFIAPPRVETGVVKRTVQAYDEQSDERWREGLKEAPHGKRWHTSFHASRFPADDPMSCDRQAMYEMMGVPPGRPSPARLVAIAEVGKAIEEHIVERWLSAGMLLSAPPQAPRQTGAEDPEHWFTCSFDAILDLRPGWPHVHPVDVKGKDEEVVRQIMAGFRGADPGHERQALTQAHFAREIHEQMGWDRMGLKPAIGASLFYVSRQRPMQTHAEVFVPLDEDRIRQGLAVLAQRRELFRGGHLPRRDPTWSWTSEPCRWCPFKTVCKRDVKHDVNELESSHAAKHARKVQSLWDFGAVQAAVLDRWAGRENDGVRVTG